MIHWGFLILAFIVGFASCWVMLCGLEKAYSRVMGAIDEASKDIRF